MYWLKFVSDLIREHRVLKKLAFENDGCDVINFLRLVVRIFFEIEVSYRLDDGSFVQSHGM